jgi:2-polyprenyl-3-methyl-5-hydroxy-6-metoxy-1,4-benzoquinol methylase
MDCDTAWVGNQPLPAGSPVAAKIVDHANPPDAIVSRVFGEAALGEPEWMNASFPLGSQVRTDCNNCNGGLYIIDGQFVPRLSPLWTKWARWCLDRPDLFADYHIHADQLGFALAMRELGERVTHLPIEWNYPTHLPPDFLSDVEPQILHYHRRLTAHCKLEMTGVTGPDRAILALNQRITEFISSRFLNQVFWDFRYSIAPDLGSGVGSRGDLLDAKRKWLSYALTGFETRPVLDVGCGDLEVTRTFPLMRYVGADVSRQALRVAREKRPDWGFIHLHDDPYTLPSADAVICLDVLIHQPEDSAFEALLAKLIACAGERLIVSGYDQPPSLTSEIVAFHRPLSEALRGSGAFTEINTIARYRDISLVIANKRSAISERHPNDMPSVGFDIASTMTDRPDLLRHLADLSRLAFGFYTKQFSRAIEYPWVADKLEKLSPGRRVLDVGAGLNPLPIFLAQRGVTVECVDPHPLERTIPADPTWNEWGYFDYGRLHAGIRSYHTDALSFDPTAPFDAVYSVSVIEHMLRAHWEELLSRCRQWLIEGGRLILTLDLVPGTELLWNYSEGREIEPPALHGDISEFLTCLDRLGFRVLDKRTMHDLPGSRTGLLLLDCVRQPSTSRH